MIEPSYRTFVVVNPESGGGFTGRRFVRIGDRVKAAVGSFEYAFTSGRGHATELTRRAIEKGYEMIVAVGGDGTFNEVVNGFFKEGRPINPNAVFAIVPRGTGGDLRKTLGVPKDLYTACSLLSGRRTRLVDVGHIRFLAHGGVETERVFINIASFGISGLVVERVNGASKVLGGRISFLLGSFRALLEYDDRTITVSSDGREPVTRPMTCVAVCNGQYFGGGMKVAPNAAMDDGYFDVTTWSGLKLVDFALNNRRIYDGTHVEDPRTQTHRTRSISAKSNERVLLDVDGEQPGYLPATINVLPAALRVKC